MASPHGKSPSLDKMLGGPHGGIGGGQKPGGFGRPSGDTSPGADTRVAPNSTVKS